MKTKEEITKNAKELSYADMISIAYDLLMEVGIKTGLGDITSACVATEKIYKKYVVDLEEIQMKKYYFFLEEELVLEVFAYNLPDAITEAHKKGVHWDDYVEQPL